MITIDGSIGEGGGQVLRTSLALSMLTGQPFRIEKIRAGRDRPGLLRQHLTAVRAARDVCEAEVGGDAIGSRELSFTPGKVTGGHYEFAVGTAGSATLVLQTVLPALLVAGERSTLLLEGGTHNPWAPPFDFLQRAFLPLVGRMGPTVTAELDRYGFYPAGGGRFRVTIDPVTRLAPLNLVERGEIRQKRATAIVSQLPMDIALRELKVVSKRLGIPVDPPDIVFVKDPVGPGNVVFIEIEGEHVTEVFTGFGQHGVRAEAVAEKVAKEVRRYLAAGVPVGEHLADQLLVLMGTAGGRFRTMAPSRHTTTNIEVIKAFLPAEIVTTCIDEARGVWEVEAKKM
jgi:RNA 3'-terminal phosphate cyclase (ATP)